jgi:hypothetical protein
VGEDAEPNASRHSLSTHINLGDIRLPCRAVLGPGGPWAVGAVDHAVRYLSLSVRNRSVLGAADADRSRPSVPCQIISPITASAGSFRAMCLV